MLPFLKYEGLGNDFILIREEDARREQVSLDAVRRLCDRRRGIGADGVLVYARTDSGARMKVMNADGSMAEMCGNGLRCVVLALHDEGQLGDEVIEVQTDAGPHPSQVVAPGEVHVEMTPASLDPEALPARFNEPLLDTPVEFDGERVHLTGVSMGNPHVVTFDVLGEARSRLGPRIEVDDRFPERVNVGFATLLSGELRLDVWERGCGWTQACGTGACAAAVAAVETGRVPRSEPLSVLLPGGRLQITVRGAGETIGMRGPARRVFEGHLDLSGFRAEV